MLALVKRKPSAKAVVRREARIEVILNSLRGAARDAWLRKWGRWIDELLRAYRVEDVQEVLGISSLTDHEALIRLLKERCHGLVESECLRAINKVIREKGYRKEVTDKMISALEQYVNTVVKQPEIEYGLPYEVTSEVQYLREHPELNHDKAFKLVHDFLIKEGAPEDNARRVAEEIASTIAKLPPKKREDVYKYAVTQAKYVKDMGLLAFMRSSKRAEELMPKASEDFKKDPLVAEFINLIVYDAEREISKKLARRLRPDELEYLRKVAGDEVGELINSGVPYESLGKFFHQVRASVVKQFFDRIPLVKELREYFRVHPKPIPKPKPSPTEVGPSVEVVRKPERTQPSGILLVQPIKLMSYGIIFRPYAPRLHRRDVVKLIEDWGAKMGFISTLEQQIRLPKKDLRLLVIYYRRDKPPTRCGLVCDEFFCTFHGCDEPVVAYYVSRMKYLHIASYDVFRK